MTEQSQWGEGMPYATHDAYLTRLESDRLSSRGIFPDSVEYTIAPRIARPIGGETLLSSNPLRSMPQRS